MAADALLADEVDIATTAEFVLVSNSFNHDDLRILGTIATARTTEVVARIDHGIQQPANLLGKRVGVTRQSTGEFFLGTFLLFNNLSLQDVEVVDLKPAEIVEAMANGQIDAAITWDPNIYKIKNSLQENAVSWPGQSGQDFYFILVSRNAWLSAHPSEAERFLQALVQAEAYMSQSAVEAQALIQQRFNYDQVYMQYIWAKHDFLVALPQEIIIAMEDEARWMIENNLTDQTTVPNYLDFIYTAGLQAVNPEAVTIIR